MREKSAAFERAKATLSQHGIPGILPELRDAGVYVRRTLLDGAHSAINYPPAGLLSPVVDASESAQLAASAEFGAETRMYIHIAFCAKKCPFCHYAVVIDRSGRSDSERVFMKHYIEALKRELRFYAEKFAKSGTTISQIYLGGGTGLILSTKQLQDLIGTVRDLFTVRNGAGFTVEGTPEVVAAPDGREKLLAVRELGANRVTFGVQSFNNAVLKSAGRGHKRELVFRAAETARSVFDNWGFDLMQGLQHGSNDTVWDDLCGVEKLQPMHLCWYQTRLPDSEIRRLKDEFEPEEVTHLGRMLIWQELEDIGYRIITGLRSLRGTWQDPFAQSHPFAVVGIGPSAYSRAIRIPGVPAGVFYRNIFDPRTYVEAVMQGRLPIGGKQVMNDEEQLAASYVVGLRRGRTEEDGRLREIRRRNPELALHYRHIEDRLLRLGVLERSNAGVKRLQFSRLGLLFQEDVLSLFYSPTVQKRRAH